MITTTLEQSNRLKELGAPQEVSHYSWYKDEKWQGPYSRLEWDEIGYGNEKRYAAYTLSELIEWLGDDFHFLQRKDNGLFYCISAFEKEVQTLYGPGATPLDAVFALCEAVKGEK